MGSWKQTLKCHLNYCTEHQAQAKPHLLCFALSPNPSAMPAVRSYCNCFSYKRRLRHGKGFSHKNTRRQGDFAAVSNVAHKCQPLHHRMPSCSLPVQKARSVRTGSQELQVRENHEHEILPTLQAAWCLPDWEENQCHTLEAVSSRMRSFA